MKWKTFPLLSGKFIQYTMYQILSESTGYVEDMTKIFGLLFIWHGKTRVSSVTRFSRDAIHVSWGNTTAMSLQISSGVWTAVIVKIGQFLTEQLEK